MSLNLPADVEPFGREWSQPGCYALQYAKPDDLRERAERRYDTLPEWFEALEECDNCLYVGKASNVMQRIEDHNEGRYRATVLTKVGCEPVAVEAIDYYVSAEEAAQEEFNTAVRLSEQTDDGTIVLSDGELV